MIYFLIGVFICALVKVYIDNKLSQYENEQLLENLNKKQKDNDRKK
jgi:hypothetical protein